MLEERLSNTYNQHNIGGYNLPQQSVTPSMYPSIASNAPNGSRGAESFYTGNSQRESYAHPQSTYSYPPGQQQQSVYNKRTSVSDINYPTLDQRNDNFPQQQNHQVQRQHTGNWQSNDLAPRYSAQSAPYSPQQQHQPLVQAQAPSNVPSQPPANFVPSEPITKASTDSNTAAYHGTVASNQPQPALDQVNSQYPVQSPPSHHALAPSPQQFTHQPSIPQVPLYSIPQQQSQQQPQQPQQRSEYWWAPNQEAPTPQQSWPTPVPNVVPSYNGYSQESFPSAPQHAPQTKVVEESLIDL